MEDGLKRPVFLRGHEHCAGIGIDAIIPEADGGGVQKRIGEPHGKEIRSGGHVCGERGWIGLYRLDGSSADVNLPPLRLEKKLEYAQQADCGPLIEKIKQELTAILGATGTRATVCCAAAIGTTTPTRAVRVSQQQQPEQCQQQHWVPLCEGDSGEAGGNTCPLRAGGVRQSTDCRSVPSESPPDAACFPEYLPGNKYAGVIGAGSWFAGERPDDSAL